MKRRVAFRATTILEPLLRRESWEITPRRRNLRTRVDDWFMRWLLVHRASDARRRLDRPHTLRSIDALLSAGEFDRRYCR